MEQNKKIGGTVVSSPTLLRIFMGLAHALYLYPSLLNEAVVSPTRCPQVICGKLRDKQIGKHFLFHIYISLSQTISGTT